LQNRVGGRGQVSSSLRTGHDREDNLSENDFRNRCRGGSCIDYFLKLHLHHFSKIKSQK
jgi:hypothetical protein